MKAYKFDGFGEPFASRRVAEQFRRVWPGHCGDLRAVEVSPFASPVWRVRTTGPWRILLDIENRTVPYNL